MKIFLDFRMRFVFRNLLLLLALVCSSAQAQLSIDIIGGGANQIPIGVLRFAGEQVLPQNISDIVEADLQRSGRFRMLFAGNVDPLPTEVAQVNFDDWKSRSADALVIGSVVRLADGRFEARFRLLDVPKQTQIGGVAFTLNAQQVRITAHRIADMIYEKLTGDRGVFSTRIAYVVKQGHRFELQIADADGAGAQTALASREPIISPAWSPDGTKLAYVSFENKKPVVYVHSLVSGRRQVVANFKGSNSAPAWSVDGSQLAVVLSKDGGSQIYLIGPDGSNPRRITHSGAIDTEPFFAPDGQSIYFTSDRGGSPQIYRMGLTGGDATRVTFSGNYNVSPRVSPDGKTLIYIARESGRFQLKSLDLASGQAQSLTDGQHDESPSIAPNGKMILYATQINNRGSLAAVSIDGRVKQRLSVQAADVREPAWGPFFNN
ncbi:MAG: Tol-Pal system beta propeller repeat protein TolB [Burkholderiales bacterium]